MSDQLFRANKIIFTEKLPSDDRNSPSPIMKRTNSAEYRDFEIREIYLRRSKVTGNVSFIADTLRHHDIWRM